MLQDKQPIMLKKTMTFIIMMKLIMKLSLKQRSVLLMLFRRKWI